MKKYHFSYMILINYNTKKTIKNLNYNQKLRSENRSKKYLDWYSKYNL